MGLKVLNFKHEGRDRIYNVLSFICVIPNSGM